MDPLPLEPVDESWDSALVVVAHPDDVEFGAAAAIARWTDQGKTVVYCMVTSGEAGIDSMEPEECRRVRMAEEIASAAEVGAETVEFLGFPDGVVEIGLPLRRAIAEQVRRHRPDVVITGNFLILVAAGVLSYGMHDLQEAGVLPGLDALAFDVSSTISVESWFGTLAKGIFNFSPQTSWLEAIAWTSYTTFAIWIFNFKQPNKSSTTKVSVTLKSKASN